MNSPLGTYGPFVASLTAVLIVAAFLVSTVFRAWLHLADADVNSLKELALIAIGAVLGTSAGVAAGQNGLKRDVAALHERLDSTGAPPAKVTDGGAL